MSVGRRATPAISSGIPDDSSGVPDDVSRPNPIRGEQAAVLDIRVRITTLFRSKLREYRKPFFSSAADACKQITWMFDSEVGGALKLGTADIVNAFLKC